MSARTRIVLVGLLLAVGVANGPTFAQASGDASTYEPSYTARLPDDALVHARFHGYDTLSLGTGDWLNEPGLPMLPAQTVRLAVPAGMRVTGVRVVSADGVDLPGEYLVQPAQPPHAASQQPAPGQWIGPDVAAYQSSEAYPGKLAEVVHQADLAGQPIAYIRLYPVQYVPATRTLRWFNTIEIIVEGTDGYVCGDSLSPAMSPAARANYEQMVRELVANPEAVELHEDETPAGALRGVAAGRYDYVIITQSSWVTGFQPLADWKTKKAVPATIVTTTWIYANYTGPDNASKLRAFVADARNTWGAMFFLLGGDTDTILYGVKSLLGDDIPNDTFYADYDEDWLCEVHVGRASVRDSAAVTTFVNKSLNYEKNPPLANFATTAGFVGFDLYEYGSGEGQNCKQYIRDTWIPSGWTYRNVYDSDAGDHWTAVMAALNQGNNLFNHADHSSTDFMGTGYTNHGAGLSPSDMSALTNGSRQSTLYSMGCWACDYASTTCIAEAFVRNTAGGGVAFIGNSRYGWYSPGYADYLSFRYDRMFFASLFQQHHQRLGDCFSDHKNDACMADDYYHYVFTELTLLGDPDLPLWTADPQALSVQFNSRLYAGRQGSFVVTVSCGGSPLMAATVCLLKAGDIYARQWTGSNGQTIFTLEPATVGTMYVTVTMENCLPSEGSTQVVAGSALFGDINADGLVDNFDINPFVDALTMGETAFHGAHPTWDYWAADCDLNGAIDNFDINPFVALLTGG